MDEKTYSLITCKIDGLPYNNSLGKSSRTIFSDLLNLRHFIGQNTKNSTSIYRRGFETPNKSSIDIRLMYPCYKLKLDLYVYLYLEVLELKLIDLILDY